MFTHGSRVTVWPIKGVGLPVLRGLVVDDGEVGMKISYLLEDRAGKALVPWTSIARVELHEVVTP